MVRVGSATAQKVLSDGLLGGVQQAQNSPEAPPKSSGLFKAAPGRKSEPVIDVDVASGGMWNLSLELPSSAN